MSVDSFQLLFLLLLCRHVYLNLWVCVEAHPGLRSWIVYQGSLLRYHVKLNVVEVLDL